MSAQSNTNPKEHTMAHEITATDNLFSVREMPWHGLGTVLSEYPTRDEAKAIAHNWEPVTAPIYRAVPGFTEGVLAECGHFLPSDQCEVCPTTWAEEPQPTTRYEAIEGQQEVVRSDNNDHIGVTNDTPGLVSNSEMYDIAEAVTGLGGDVRYATRSEEHTSELQSLMRTQYTV